MFTGEVLLRRLLLALSLLLVGSVDAFAGHLAGCQLVSPRARIDPMRIQKMIQGGQAVNLDGVVLAGGEINLSRQVVRWPLRITNSVVEGPVNFIDTLFMDDLDMSGTVFGGTVRVERAIFSRDENWRCARFAAEFSHHTTVVNGSAVFDDAVFMKGGTFSGARILHAAHFTRARFEGPANFISAHIEKSAIFEGAVFSRDAIFERAEIVKSAWFRERPTGDGVIPGAQFIGVADFKATRIGGQAEFSGVVFRNEVRMTEARFNEVLFRRTQFLSAAKIEENEVSLSDAEFGALDFGGGEQRAFFAPSRWVQMAGFRYRSLKSPHFMLPLLAKLRPYQREPYTQLEKYWRDGAEPDQANRVYYARRQVESRALSLTAQPLRWAWDAILRYLFGYGVNLRVPAFWVVGVVFVTTCLLMRRGALVPPPMNENATIAAETNTESVKARAVVALRISIGLLIPKFRLLRAKGWRVSDAAVAEFRRPLPVTYKQFASFARYVTWVIITISLSIFSISDLVKN